MRAEINEIEKTNNKININNTKNWVLENTNNIEKSTAKKTMTERKVNQQNTE